METPTTTPPDDLLTAAALAVSMPDRNKRQRAEQAAAIEAVAARIVAACAAVDTGDAVPAMRALYYWRMCLSQRPIDAGPNELEARRVVAALVIPARRAAARLTPGGAPDAV